MFVSNSGMIQTPILTEMDSALVSRNREILRLEAELEYAKVQSESWDNSRSEAENVSMQFIWREKVNELLDKIFRLKERR